jgi:uncharacterized protein YndB with AHSA1/START domain
MTADIVHEATYPYPPDLVWRALTSPEALRAWLMEHDLSDARTGARFQFRDRPRPFWDGVCRCEVVEADPPRRFALRWGLDAEGRGTDVAWTLAPAPGGGTRVAFRHAGLSGPMGWIMKKGMEKGWRAMLDRSIPLVCQALAEGRTPSREACTAARRAG